MNIKDKLSLLMNEKGINKADLSRQTGIPYTTIDGILKRDNFEKLKLATLDALKKYFNVTLDYLIDDSVEDRNHGKKQAAPIACTEKEKLIQKINKLNDKGCNKVSGFIDGLLESSEYRMDAAADFRNRA